MAQRSSEPLVSAESGEQPLVSAGSGEKPLVFAHVTLPGDVDLHARPAADFVRAAMSFESQLWVAVGEREVDGKSLLSILALGAKRGSELRLRAEGADATAAVECLAALVSSLHE